jgi:hypothetical protein
MDPEAVRADGTLDPEVLKRQGWLLKGSAVFYNKKLP